MLIPLMKGAECCVLAGDPKQLPATVLSAAAAAAGLNEPMFSRLEIDCGLPVTLLDTQYRMHPAISKFPSLRFYDGKVKSGVPGSDRPPPKGIPWPNENCPGMHMQVRHLHTCHEKNPTSHIDLLITKSASILPPNVCPQSPS